LEIAKAQKEELKALKGPEKIIGKDTRLQDLKNLGITIKKAKNGRR
jgi:hypothetical protein